ncbi:hypothetical protein BCL69_100773 [Nitrosomonas communis]|uniref:Uncharacterized protein n=1 Tax=Nitrosomonas communis TaxID=44574 RepID=A0A0F7KHA2_9PROT|nr:MULTISPECIES: hypothetical protein [Nitrosomonas]AKH38876.1 hypothetical protein AAW31_15440 [Nitrosomonas communis]TYP91912.1 hypothetical protein BCL69_100773 [Nitrosomonas communis]
MLNLAGDDSFTVDLQQIMSLFTCLIKSPLINPAKNFFHPHPARWLVVQLAQEDSYESIEEVVGMLSSMLMYELMTLSIPLKM